MKTCTTCLTTKPKSEFNKRGLKCKPCVKEYNKAYRATRLEELREQSRAYALLHKDVLSVQRKAHYVENKAEIREAQSIYRKENIERLKAAARVGYHVNKAKNAEKRRLYGIANREKESRRAAQWHIDNPNAKRIASHNRRQKLSGGKLSKDIADKLYSAQKGRCACCKLPLGDDYHLDHIMPVHLGGKNEDCNIQLLHSACNLQKHAKHPIDFMQSRGFLL